MIKSRCNCRKVENNSVFQRMQFASLAVHLQDFDFTIDPIPNRANNILNIMLHSTVEEELPTVTFGVSSIEIENDSTVLHKAQHEAIKEVPVVQVPRKKPLLSKFKVFYHAEETLMNRPGISLICADSLSGSRMLVWGYDVLSDTYWDTKISLRHTKC